MEGSLYVQQDRYFAAPARRFSRDSVTINGRLTFPPKHDRLIDSRQHPCFVSSKQNYDDDEISHSFGNIHLLSFDREPQQHSSRCRVEKWGKILVSKSRSMEVIDVSALPPEASSTSSSFLLLGPWTDHTVICCVCTNCDAHRIFPRHVQQQSQAHPLRGK